MRSPSYGNLKLRLLSQVSAESAFREVPLISMVVRLGEERKPPRSLSLWAAAASPPSHLSHHIWWTKSQVQAETQMSALKVKLPPGLAMDIAS